MTRSEAAAAIGQRVRVKGGKYDGRTGSVREVHRRLALVEGGHRPNHFSAWLSPFRLHLIDEPKKEARD